MVKRQCYVINGREVSVSDTGLRDADGAIYQVRTTDEYGDNVTRLISPSIESDLVSEDFRAREAAIEALGLEVSYRKSA